MRENKQKFSEVNFSMIHKPENAKVNLGKDLLKLARESISEEFNHTKTKIDEILKQKYSDKKGAFVTLTKDGDLRGCIGMIEPVMPLWKTIHEMAKNAAFSDPRFPPLTYEELGEIRIEISVLTLPKLLSAKKPEEYTSQIEIGRDGLIIQRDKYKGLLLPQVFPEWKVDALGALEMTCEKAELEHDAWKQIGKTRVYTFQCEIIHE